MTACLRVGIMGGSGLDDPQILQNRREKSVNTPFGKPSDVVITGTIEDVQCVLLARHGRKHDTYPTNVNYRANLYALKQEGCTHVIVTTACGSLQEQIEPGNLVIIDSFIDRTTKRASTYYDGSCAEFQGVCHIPMYPTFCDNTRKVLIDSCNELGIPHHDSGTMVSVEGPRFSTRAESNIFRLWGASVINMTTCPETNLAKELGLCYASIALATDYDCWRESNEAVSVEMVLATFKDNASKAIKLLLHSIPKLASTNWQETSTKAIETAKHSVMPC